MVILFIGLAILGIVLLVFLVKSFLFKREIVKDFESNNVIVFGKKGCGKDLLFSEVIRKRKAPYVSNCDYGGDAYIPFQPSQISLAPNDFRSFIDDKITTIVKDDALEGVDFYLSDGGIYFPSQYDGVLDKKYPSLPIFYALSRHLYASNFHINTQALGRVWLKIREQADTYIKACRVIKIPFFLIVKARIYDKYESALNDVRPLKVAKLNKYAKSEANLFKASQGYVKEGYMIVRKKSISYDTRLFHSKLFGYPYGAVPNLEGGLRNPQEDNPNELTETIEKVRDSSSTIQRED